MSYPSNVFAGVHDSKCQSHLATGLLFAHFCGERIHDQAFNSLASPWRGQTLPANDE